MAEKNEKQPFADVSQNRCSYKFRKIHREKPVLESIFNTVAGQCICFPMDVVRFLRTSIFWETSGNGCFCFKQSLNKPFSLLKCLSSTAASPVNIDKFLRKAFFIEHHQWLLFRDVGYVEIV